MNNPFKRVSFYHLLLGVGRTTGAGGASNVASAGTWEFAPPTKSTNLAKGKVFSRKATLQAMQGWSKRGSRCIRSPSFDLGNVK